MYILLYILNHLQITYLIQCKHDINSCKYNVNRQVVANVANSFCFFDPSGIFFSQIFSIHRCRTHGQRGPIVHCEMITTVKLINTSSTFHFSLSCIGEGNGNPLQCFCLENPRDGGAWWATIYGVAQSRTRLKRLSSSSTSRGNLFSYFGVVRILQI